MPSYRVDLEIGALRPGRRPQEVLDAAVASLAGWHVDATDIDVIDGIPRVLVRFAVPPSSRTEEDATAMTASRSVIASVGLVAGTRRCWVRRRRAGRWLPIG